MEAEWTRFAALGRRGWALLGAGFALGLAAAAAFTFGMHATGTDEFCASCHARDAVPEWRASAHYLNRSGFVAGCADCHLPAALGPRLLRKARGATLEVWGHLTGVIDTPEKYEARRPAMAQAEWQRMRANGARECRACHHPQSMADKGNPSLRSLHEGALAGGQICTDCHQGIAHRAPAAK